ncbi:HK97 family phage prohead protease [Frigoriglobus tundricola]|uniref:HK97 family phage prohead protease n=1 Tax=Frigoriglobus tundricola TaxID=2774151 RepID=UPI00148EECEC|nr:HK97 family phage prohead protease [Frigoriglobus tundricola]
MIGYAAVFHNPGDQGTVYEVERGLFERIAPTAFERDLRDGQDILACVAHDERFTLGSTTDGRLHLSVDPRGLAFRLTLPDTAVGEHVAHLVHTRRVWGCSINFDIRASRRFRVRGVDAVELTDVRLCHIALTNRPAYRSTTCVLRSGAGPD